MKLTHLFFVSLVLVAFWFLFLDRFTLEATNKQLADLMDPIFNILKQILDATLDFLGGLLP